MPSSPSIPITGPELVNRNESGDVLIISLDGLMKSIVSQLVRKKIEMEIPTQVSTQRKRPISQVTVAPTKKLSKHTLEKLKKF